MMYRTLRQARRDIVALQTHLASAIAADDTRDTMMHVGAARKAAVLLDRRLQELSERRSGDTPERPAASPRHAWFQAVKRLQDSLADGWKPEDRLLIQAARRAIGDLFSCTQRVELGTTVTEMRETVVTCKTLSDFADAYVGLALGFGDRRVPAVASVHASATRVTKG